MPHTVLERRALCFSSLKHRKLKVKLWWVGARQRKKVYFVPFINSKRNFFNICVLAQCIVYWIHFQNIYVYIYIYIYIYIILHINNFTISCLLSKLPKALSVSFNRMKLFFALKVELEGTRIWCKIITWKPWVFSF